MKWLATYFRLISAVMDHPLHQVDGPRLILRRSLRLKFRLLRVDFQRFVYAVGKELPGKGMDSTCSVRHVN